MRIYDDDTTPEGEEVNLLTVIPNESYQTFVTQYQSELGHHVPMRHRPKGKTVGKKKVRLNRAQFDSDPFRRFWNRLSQRTDYSVYLDENALVRECVEKLNSITLQEYAAEIELTRIESVSVGDARATSLGRETIRLSGDFAAMDVIEELSENTALAYPTVVEIVKGITTLDQFVRNPPRYLHLATDHINRIAVELRRDAPNCHRSASQLRFANRLEADSTECTQISMNPIPLGSPRRATLGCTIRRRWRCRCRHRIAGSIPLHPSSGESCGGRWRLGRTFGG